MPVTFYGRCGRNAWSVDYRMLMYIGPKHLLLRRMAAQHNQSISQYKHNKTMQYEFVLDKQHGGRVSRA